MRLKEIKPNMVIHCTTKDEVLLLLKMFPTNTLTVGLWNTYGNETCLHVNENRTLSYGDCSFYFYEGYKITEFSDLIIPELSAKEVLETIGEICCSYPCTQCPFGTTTGNGCLASKRTARERTDEVIDICTKWHEEHPKEEKKELETEWVYVVRIIKVHDNGKKECVMEIEEVESGDGIDDKIEHDLKLYTKNHKGNFFSTLEHICRIKE